MDAQMVTVKTYINRGAAEGELHVLDSAGLHPQVRADDCGGALPSLSLAEIVVPREEAENARSLLAYRPAETKE